MGKPMKEKATMSLACAAHAKTFRQIHDEIRDRERKLAAVPGLGFELVSTFVIPVDTWLTEYFRPLGKRLHELADKYARRPDLLAVLAKEEAELEAFRARPEDFASVFYVLRKGTADHTDEEKKRGPRMSTDGNGLQG